MDTKLEKLALNAGIIDPGKIATVLEEGVFGCMLDWKVWDPKTGIVKEEHSQKSESFTQQFLQLLFVKMSGILGATGISVKDITNTNRACVDAYFATGQGALWCAAAAALVTNGIIIGTGVTGVDITDYKIETLIAHATMNYSIQGFAVPAADATTSQMTLTRNFSNVSGGDVTVNEIALYCACFYSPATSQNFCIIRDNIAGGITVPNGQTLTVNYRPQAVV